MKKLTVSFLTAVTLTASSLTAGVSVQAKACELPACSNLFTDTIDGLLSQNGVFNADVIYSTEKLYDLQQQEVGCLYDFSVNGENGYAVLVNNEGEFCISEVFLNAENPYKNVRGVKTYPAVSVYMDYFEGQYFDAETGVPYTEAAIETLSEKSFNGGESSVSADAYRVYYQSRTALDDGSYLMCGQHPTYVGIEGYQNICVSIAASNIIGYWDRFKPNLISDFEPGELYNGIYFYSGNCSETDATTRQLAIDMNAGNGTSVAECKSGMTTFCERAGYSVSFTNLTKWSVFTGKTFDYTAAKQKMRSGEPILIFSEGFSAYEISENIANSYDTYIGLTCDANHAMAGFGYLDVTYTFSDGTTETDNFIRVATGQTLQTEGYYNIKTHTINDAISVNIE